MVIRKRAADLFSEPPDLTADQAQEPPVSKGMEILSTLDGDRLETVTRTNRAIVAGINAGTAYVARYNSIYIRQRTERLMRLAISMGGKGRQDIVDLVKAGGTMTDAYYARGGQSEYPVDDD